MTERKHSPLPWRVIVKDNSYSIHCKDCMISQVFRDPVVSKETWARQIQDAKLIVQSVNSHYELIEALEGILEIGKRDMSNPKYDGFFEDARQALSKAKGEA